MLSKITLLSVFVYLFRYSLANYFEACDSATLGSFLPVLGNCAAYIYCNGSASFQDECPTSAYFDAVAQECVFDEHFDCERSTAAVNVLGQSTRPTTTNAVHKVPKCSRETDEHYFAHSQRCEYYYKCVRGYLSIVRCNSNYGWDNSRQICVPIEQADCYGSAAV